MKKLIFILLLLAGIPSTSQTLVASQKLELKRPWDNRQVFASAYHSENFFAFASDKQKVYALKYNSALFFRDSLSACRAPKDYSFMAGTSFDSIGNPRLQWLSDDHSKLRVTAFDFVARRTMDYDFEISYENETFLSAFPAANNFYLATISDAEQKLTLRWFENGQLHSKTLDFSPFQIETVQQKKIDLADFFESNPLQFIDTASFCPLSVASAAAKIYADASRILITFDHNPAFTQVFSISLTDYTISESKISQPEMSIPLATQSNSFYNNQQLYQIRYSRQELALSAINAFDPDAARQIHRAQLRDTISFKNSPLFLQNGDNRPSEVKSTPKFLQRLDGCSASISVYNSEQGLLLTCGGVRQIANTTHVILGATLGVGIMAAGGGSINPEDFFDRTRLQQVYFESLFDGSFKHLNQEQRPIADDLIPAFFADNDDITAYSLATFARAKILAYYDSRNKAIVLRKFEDVNPLYLFGN